MFVKEQFRLESVTLWRNILGVDLEFQFCLNQAILLFTRPSNLRFRNFCVFTSRVAEPNLGSRKPFNQLKGLGDNAEIEAAAGTAPM